MSAHIKNTVIEDVTKKDICRYYILGRCIMGSQCKFRHELDFEFMKKTLKFCHDFQNSTGCLRQHCTFLHATKEEQILFITTGQLPKVLAERHAMMSAATAERHAMMSAATAETIPQIALYIQESSASTAAPPPPPPPPLPAATASAPQPRSAPSQPAFTSGYRRPSVGSVAPMVPQWTPLAARHTSMMPMQQLPRPPPQPTSTITSVRQHAPVFTGPTPGPTFGMVQPPPLIPMYDASKPPPPIMPMRVQPTNGPSKRQSSNEDGNACPSKLRKGDEAIADCEQWLQKEQRDQSAQAARARNRHNSLARTQNNVIALHERFNRFAIDDESLMIATVVFMRESIAKFSERTLNIDQLFPLRHRLRVHVWQLMNGEYAAGNEEQLCDVILERQSEFINRIGTITPLPSDVDLVASLRAVLTHFLNEAALLINVDSHYIVFCRRFRALFSQMFYEICGVVSSCCQDGVEGLGKIYRAFMIDLIKNIDEPAREQLLSLAMDNLETAVRRMEIWSSNYLQYVRRIPSACKIEEQETVQESAESTSVKTEVTEDDVDVTIKKETEEPCASSEPSVEHSPMDWQIPVPEPMDTDIEVMPAEAAAPVVDSAPIPTPIATSSPQQTPGHSRQLNSNSTTTDSSNEAGFVPPAQLAQHWGEEWVPTLTDDQHRQRAADSDEPFSDAYLSGMPPKKRRCVREGRPSVVLDAFIAESVREVATPLTAVSDEWRALFREELTREARRRVARSADYEPDRFTATARFLAQTSNPRPPSDTEEMASQMSCRK